MKQYYVYRHRTETDNRVYYIGCGDEKRPYYKSNRSKEWKDIYNNEGLIVEILLETEDEEEALKIESEYIKKYGRIEDGGTLVNKSTYGRGYYNHTEETKQKMSEAKIREKHFLFGKPSPNRKSVLQYTKSGDFIKEWSSAYDAAKELNLHQPAICMCCRGKIKNSGGFIWRFKE